MCHIAICGLSSWTVVSQTVRFFEDTLSDTKCVFWFSIQFFFSWKIFDSKKTWAICYRKCTYVFMWKYELFLSHFNETWIFWTDFSKKKSVRMSKISFKKICVRWKRSCTVRTDRQTDMIEANSRFPQFCEHAKYKKKKTPHSAHRAYLYVIYNFAQQAVSILVNYIQRLVVSRGIFFF